MIRTCDEPLAASTSQSAARSVSTPFALPFGETNMDHTACVIGGFKKHLNEYNKYKKSETDTSYQFFESDYIFKILCICDLEDSEEIFGADIFYHSVCMSTYLKNYKDVEKRQVESIIKFGNGYIS